MKSYCVLNSAVTAAVAESIGSAVAEVLGGKLGVLYCGSESSSRTAANIAKGIKRLGGCAVAAGEAFEAQTAFACRHFSLDGALFVGGTHKSVISVFDGGARALTPAQEEEISVLAAGERLSGHRGGNIIRTDLNSVYYKYLLEEAADLDGVTVSVKSDNLSVRSNCLRTLLALGGQAHGRAVFCISPSGLCVSAVDEYGKIRTRDELLAALYAVKITRERSCVELAFSLSEGLDALARDCGVSVKRSFTGGNELFTRDAVVLTVMLMKYMSQIGCGLGELCSAVPDTAVSRKSLSAAVDIKKLADSIECDTLVTDGSRVFARLADSSVLVTPDGCRGRYCLEVRSADSETAREIALNLTDIYN